jgi:hypothetical protein
LKVPKHYPLVLLIGVRLKFRINSTFFNFKVIEFGGAALERNFNVTVERAAWEAYNATWNLGTNSAFALGPRKTT